MGQEVAVKVVLHSVLNTQRVARECELIMGLQHPNIVRSFEFLTWQLHAAGAGEATGGSSSHQVLVRCRHASVVNKRCSSIVYCCMVAHATHLASDCSRMHCQLGSASGACPCIRHATICALRRAALMQRPLPASAHMPVPAAVAAACPAAGPHDDARGRSAAAPPGEGSA
jgi:hypothetical protein